jgi:BirA family transcriptional regulator, biotin operon repressor / biotin---[acetyl-CoA-carboxylase] ligase
LIENSVMDSALLHSIIGIGLNVNQSDFEKTIPNVISMKKITGKEYILHEELNRLLICLKTRLMQLKEKKLEQIKFDYLKNLYKHGDQQVFKASGTKFKGLVEDVGPTGELVILSEDGKKLKFMFKEIQFIE